MVTDSFFDLQRFDGIDADNALWDQIATVGGSDDTDATHHGNVYELFYTLGEATNEIYGNTLAGFLNDDAEPQTVNSVINIVGQSPLGTPEALGTAAHVTLSTGSGTNVGAVPVNIQANENAAVVDVEVNLTSSTYPSTVAVGTSGTETVTASHTIRLSNAGGYGYLGANTNGQNVLAAGTTGAMLRHDGDTRASVIGGAGNDSIRAGQNDYVEGGTGADLFYDTEDYAIQDYDPTADAIIATKLSSLDEVTVDNVSGTGNKIAIGEGQQITFADKDENEAIQVQVAVMDDDGNVTSGRKDVVVANGNGVVSVASTANTALVIANSLRGASVNQVIGSAQSDQIYVGDNDSVDGGAGNDSITIDDDSTGVVVALSGNGGTDTVKGWVFGFNPYPNEINNGATKLEVGSSAFRGRVVEDKLEVSVSGASMVFEDTENLGSNHGQFDVLIGTDEADIQYTAIRTGGYASVTSNENIADYYLSDDSNVDPNADSNTDSLASYGFVEFTSDVTEDLDDFGEEHGFMRLDSDRFNAIRELRLYNNSHASVVGSSARETVRIAGDFEASASKAVSLAGDNDVIFSSGDTGTGNTFYFGAGDGRDTIHSFGHYLGVDNDPEKQKADRLYLTSFTGLRVDTYEDGDRVVFNTTESDDVVIYEGNKLDPNNKMYQVEIQGYGAKIAKIGYTNSDATANNFTYDKEVSYYVGASGNARDTLTVDNTASNVWLWLDGSQNGGEFYRGIGVVNASSATNTNISIAGSADNNTIIGGGEGTFNFLWGGAGDNSLVGSEAGKDWFLYYKDSASSIQGAAGMGGNHDTVEGYDNTNDIIFLGDITIDDINEAAMVQSGNLGIGENAVTVEFKNGGSLTVNGTSDTTFHMANGGIYTADRSSGQWVKNA